MYILIPGGCGFIGSSLAIYLKNNIKNCKILSIDNLSRSTSLLNEKKISNYNIQNLKLDLASKKCLQYLKSLKIKIDLIIDCCSDPSVENSKIMPEYVFDCNLKSTLNLLEIAKINKSKIIYLSSSRVYSIHKINNLFSKVDYKNKLKKKIKINENFSTESPITLYGFTKLASEKLIQEYSYLYKIKYIVNRFAVVSGYGQFGKQDQGFVSMWLWRHLNNIDINYNGYGGHGNQVRDILDISDLCNLIREQISKFHKIYDKVFNVGGGLKNSLSLRELSNYCEIITKNKVNIKGKTLNSNYDIRYFITDNSKIYKFYKWRVKKNLRIIISETYSSLIKNKKILKKIL